MPARPQPRISTRTSEPAFANAEQPERSAEQHAPQRRAFEPTPTARRGIGDVERGDVHRFARAVAGVLSGRAGAATKSGRVRITRKVALEVDLITDRDIGDPLPDCGVCGDQMIVRNLVEAKRAPVFFAARAERARELAAPEIERVQVDAAHVLAP